MKRLSYVMLVVIALTFVHCSNNDDNHNGQGISVMGTWNLVKVSGSFAGATYEFEEGEVTWKFEENIEMIRITNNNNDTGAYSGPESGHYDYQYVNNESKPEDCAKNLEVGSTLNMGCREIIGNTMVFTQTEADGFIFTFKKQASN